MLDRAARRRLDPLLDRLAARCIARGLSANAVTLIGFGIGLVAMLAVATRHEWVGLVLLLANRAADGIDGAIARQTKATERGGYLDIVLDFILYSGVPFAFAVGHPDSAVAAAFLIFSFVGTGTSFLAFAVFRRDAPKQGKAFHYLGGLTEGTETIAFFVLVLLVPATFDVAAALFGLLCWVTTAGRIVAAVSALR
jgi:phosphatidylglycerophosphate synthase